MSGSLRWSGVGREKGMDPQETSAQEITALNLTCTEREKMFKNGRKCSEYVTCMPEWNTAFVMVVSDFFF